MKRTSREYLDYLKEKKNISKNTELSYRGDLDKMIEYFYIHRIFDYELINETNLNSYVLYLELKGSSSSTIARNIAVMKGYFDFLFKKHYLKECITDSIQKPVIEKRQKSYLKKEMIDKLLEAAKGETPKAQRDVCIMQLMCQEGIQVSEIIGITLQDVDYEVGFIRTYARNKNKIYRIKDSTIHSIKSYVEEGRKLLVLKEESSILFTNMKGEQLSRQGIWKMVKTYAKAVGIEDISPAKLSGSNECK